MPMGCRARNGAENNTTAKEGTTMKGKTRITINRETLKALLEEHISRSMLGDYHLLEWTVHRNSSVELVITPKSEAVLPLDAEPGV